jgi:diaminopimelate epimerase
MAPMGRVGSALRAGLWRFVVRMGITRGMSTFMPEGTSTGLPFRKMHGAGNDFVILDARRQALALGADLARALADRHRGVGFDQLAIIEAGDSVAAAKLRFLNADGSESAACGNATRCIARMIMDETGTSALSLRTARGLLHARTRHDGLVEVNMGAPLLNWHEIPLAKAMDTLHLPIAGDPVATGMGNPHCTFFVDDINAVDLATAGPAHEHHPLFPQSTNVEFVQVLARDAIRLRIWERGTGITLASGSCSCAAVVAAARRGMTGRSVRVDVDGGTLWVDWSGDGVWMAGPTAHVFDGVLTPAFLAGLS